MKVLFMKVLIVVTTLLCHSGLSKVHGQFGLAGSYPYQQQYLYYGHPYQQVNQYPGAYFLPPIAQPNPLQGSQWQQPRTQFQPTFADPSINLPIEQKILFAPAPVHANSDTSEVKPTVASSIVSILSEPEQIVPPNADLEPSPQQIQAQSPNSATSNDELQFPKSQDVPAISPKLEPVSKSLIANNETVPLQQAEPDRTPPELNDE